MPNLPQILNSATPNPYNSPTPYNSYNGGLSGLGAQPVYGQHTIANDRLDRLRSIENTLTTILRNQQDMISAMRQLARMMPHNMPTQVVDAAATAVAGRSRPSRNTYEELERMAANRPAPGPRRSANFEPMPLPTFNEMIEMQQQDAPAIPMNLRISEQSSTPIPNPDNRPIEPHL